MQVRDVSDRSPFHVLDRTLRSVGEFPRGSFASGAGRYGYEANASSGWKELHRKFVKHRCRTRHHREPECLHIQEPVWALRAEITVDLDLRRDNVADL